jgi:hypothetical protein
MRPFVLAAVAALALAAAPAAVAKEITQAQVCGADGCTSVDDESDRAVLINGGPPRTPPAAAPYYEVRLTMDEGDQKARFGFAAVPERHALRNDEGTWIEMPPEMTALITNVAAGHRAFPAGDLTGAAPPPAPRSRAADAGSPLWPEGALIGLVLAAAGMALAYAVRASRRYRPSA